MKTILTAVHKAGPLENGADGCHARFGNFGMCPGVSTAEWLNKLPDDDVVYCTIGGKAVTCGDVRDSWLRQNDHIVAVEPRIADLTAERRRLERRLEDVNNRIAEAAKTKMA